jgi:hypothetical protein
MRGVALDLNATARGNSSVRHAAADAAESSDASGVLSRFRRFAASAEFATNLSFDKVIACDETGKLLDTRSYHVHVAEGDAARGKRDFEVRQGPMLGPREGFEDLWDGGREFVYGALNAGTMGVESFGNVCVVLVNADALFPSDTAQRYVDALGNVDGARARDEATAWANRGDLAALERGRQAKVSSDSDWPEVICDGDEYLESILTHPVTLDGLSEARLRVDLRRRLETLRARRLIGEALSSVETGELAAYDALHGWRKQHSVTIQELP